MSWREITSCVTMPAGVAGTDLAVSGLVRNELTVDGTERGCKLGTVWQKFGKKICNVQTVLLLLFPPLGAKNAAAVSNTD